MNNIKVLDITINGISIKDMGSQELHDIYIEIGNQLYNVVKPTDAEINEVINEVENVIGFENWILDDHGLAASLVFDNRLSIAENESED